MHSLARKSLCFKVEGGKGTDALRLSYEIPPPPPKQKRAPGGGRKPAPRMSENDLKELLDRRIAFYRWRKETGH